MGRCSRRRRPPCPEAPATAARLSKNAIRCALSWYFAGGSETRMVSTFSGWKPGSTCSTRQKLVSRRLAPLNNTQATAICAATSTLRPRLRPPAKCPQPSLSLSLNSPIETLNAARCRTNCDQRGDANEKQKNSPVRVEVPWARQVLRPELLECPRSPHGKRQPHCAACKDDTDALGERLADQLPAAG